MNLNRRSFVKHGLTGTALGLPLVSALANAAQHGLTPNALAGDRILVVVELSGGNDGLNTVVPFADDAYYRLRPNIGIKPNDLLKIDDHYGFNPGMLGLERLWKSGELAIVHGCGYANPSYSHFTSMAYWHTASPNSGDEFGWMGRLADSMSPQYKANMLLNIGNTQSLAVKSRVHTPVVFDDPSRFQRSGFAQQRELLDRVATTQSSNASRIFLNEVATSARHSSELIRAAWSNYKSPVDYGIAALDLPKVAACISAGFPTQLYHVAFRNNAFDTHVQQPALHQRLLSYACDGIHGFIRDMERLGLSDKVCVLVYSEFGRRVAENANLGTDHGSANTMFIAGKNVQGGHYGIAPKLTDLTEGGNLKHTVDFRQVYATVIKDWLRHNNTDSILKGAFSTLPIFSQT